ncbi:MAG: hypothetical protein AAGA03_17155 [Planctomycetota bacterium]
MYSRQKLRPLVFGVEDANGYRTETFFSEANLNVLVTLRDVLHIAQRKRHFYAQIPAHQTVIVDRNRRDLWQEVSVFTFDVLVYPVTFQ